jgi:hypothetical protein
MLAAQSSPVSGFVFVVAVLATNIITEQPFRYHHRTAVPRR